MHVWQAMDLTLRFAGHPDLHFAVIYVFDIYASSDGHEEFRDEQRELLMVCE
jgi:hypothetical protein